MTDMKMLFRVMETFLRIVREVHIEEAEKSCHKASLES